MNQNDLINEVAAVGGTTKVVAEQALKSVLTAIANGLKHGSDVSLKDIGVLHVVKVAPRPFKNIQSGQKEMSEGSVTVRLKVSSVIKAALN